MNRRTEVLTVYTSVFHTHLPNTIPRMSVHCDVRKVPNDKLQLWKYPSLSYRELRGSVPMPQKMLNHSEVKMNEVGVPPNKRFLASHHTCSSHFYYLRVPCSEPQTTILT